MPGTDSIAHAGAMTAAWPPAIFVTSGLAYTAHPFQGRLCCRVSLLHLDVLSLSRTLARGLVSHGLPLQAAMQTCTLQLSEVV